MFEYEVFSKATGEKVFSYPADEPIAWDGLRFDEYDHVPSDVVAAPPTRYGGRRLLTKLEFLRLFSPVERVSLRTAAKSSPELEDYMALMELAQDISLDDGDTITGVQMLEAAGLLASGRAAEILNG